MKKNILILEDNIHTASNIENLIYQTHLSVSVIKAHTIESAYKALSENIFDLFIIDIIIDTSIPGDTSGIRFAHDIRANSIYEFTPIIFITALADPSLHAYRNIHCYGYLEKPFSQDNAIALIKNALHFTTLPNQPQYIYLRHDGILYSVNVEEVIYFQVQHHKMKIVLKNDCWEIPYKTIKSILQDNNSRNLIQCNRYTVINSTYIKYIDYRNQYIKMKDVDEFIEIGRQFKKNLGEFQIC